MEPRLRLGDDHGQPALKGNEPWGWVFLGVEKDIEAGNERKRSLLLMMMGAHVDHGFVKRRSGKPSQTQKRNTFG